MKQTCDPGVTPSSLATLDLMVETAVSPDTCTTTKRQKGCCRGNHGRLRIQYEKGVGISYDAASESGAVLRGCFASPGEAGADGFEALRGGVDLQKSGGFFAGSTFSAARAKQLYNSMDIRRTSIHLMK